MQSKSGKKDLEDSGYKNRDKKLEGLMGWMEKEKEKVKMLIGGDFNEDRRKRRMDERRGTGEGGERKKIKR